MRNRDATQRAGVVCDSRSKRPSLNGTSRPPTPWRRPLWLETSDSLPRGRATSLPCTKGERAVLRRIVACIAADTGGRSPADAASALSQRACVRSQPAEALRLPRAPRGRPGSGVSRRLTCSRRGKEARRCQSLQPQPVQRQSPPAAPGAAAAPPPRGAPIAAAPSSGSPPRLASRPAREDRRARRSRAADR